MPMSQHRPALAAILVAVVAVLFPSADARVAAAPSPSPIVEVALRDDGTWQGECWQWMQRVVREATGAAIGFDYREGFFEAGATEVSIEDALPGDIIQVALDTNTAPDADYDGLHTAIIVRNRGDGTFDVINSNQNFDGMVMTREAYNPVASASRYGLQVHIYRITGEPKAARTTFVKPDVTAPVPGQSFSAGEKARVATPGECLRLRTEPGGNVINCLPHDTSVTANGGVRVVDRISWVWVSTPMGGGWVASDFLAKELAPTAGTSAAGPVKPLLRYRAFVPFASAD